MSERIDLNPETNPVLRVEEVAEILGISRGSAFTAVNNGTIPSIRIGKRIAVPTAFIRRMLMLDGPTP